MVDGVLGDFLAGDNLRGDVAGFVFECALGIFEGFEQMALAEGDEFAETDGALELDGLLELAGLDGGDDLGQRYVLLGDGLDLGADGAHLDDADAANHEQDQHKDAGQSNNALTHGYFVKHRRQAGRAVAHFGAELLGGIVLRNFRSCRKGLFTHRSWLPGF